MADQAIQTLPLSQLQPNPFQPRSKIKDEDIQDLAKSVKTFGILEPLVVAHTPAGYQIIAGERRWRAAKVAGLEEVPVFIKQTTPKGMLEMALVENVQRSDLSVIERAQAFQQLARDFSYNHLQIANRIGKSESYVSNTLRLLNLPDAIKDGLAGNLITEGHARALIGIGDEKIMIECYKVILKENASVRRAEDLARRFKSRSGKPNPSGRSNIVSDEIDLWRQQLQNSLSQRSQVKLTRSSRQTKVTITLSGSPEQTQSDLDKILKITEASK